MALAGCGGNNSKKKLPSLQETYNRTDKKPFGSYVAFRQLDAIYRYNSIRETYAPFNRVFADMYDTSSLYISVSRNLFLRDEELNAMMLFAGEGNDLFIAADNIDDDLLTRLNCQVYHHEILPYLWYDSMKYTMLSTATPYDSSYGYYYVPFRNYFIKADMSRSRVLGYNDEGRANFMVFFTGKGRVFVHCDPRVFSNYFLLTANNTAYLSYLLSFVRPSPTRLYWDNYYNKRNSDSDEEGGGSSLSAIMNQPPLASAFWLGLAALLLYILFGIKRTQREVEVIKPNENSTVTFTETIGRLYLQKKDNRNIADKMVTYFNEQVRNTYFLNTNNTNTDFISMLSRKSGVDQEHVTRLYETITRVQAAGSVTDADLLKLNELIQQFNKKIKS